MDRITGTIRKAQTSSAKVSWAKNSGPRLCTASPCRGDSTAGGRPGNGEHHPGDGAEHKRQCGGDSDVRLQSELGVDHHWQHVDAGGARECGAEGAHGRSEADGAGRDEGRLEAGYDNIAD